MTGTGYAYNGNGSPTNYQGQPLSFDPENRLTVLNGGLGSTYAYDGDGLQTVKQTAHLVAGRPGVVGPKTTYTPLYKLYDGTEPVCEYGASAVFSASNTFGADGLVSRRTSSTTTFYTFDERGNVSQRTSSTGSVLSAATCTTLLAQAKQHGRGGRIRVRSAGGVLHG